MHLCTVVEIAWCPCYLFLGWCLDQHCHHFRLHLPAQCDFVWTAQLDCCMFVGFEFNLVISLDNIPLPDWSEFKGSHHQHHVWISKKGKAKWLCHPYPMRIKTLDFTKQYPCGLPSQGLYTTKPLTVEKQNICHQDESIKQFADKFSLIHLWSRKHCMRVRMETWQDAICLQAQLIFVQFLLTIKQWASLTMVSIFGLESSKFEIAQNPLWSEHSTASLTWHQHLFATLLELRFKQNLFDQCLLCKPSIMIVWYFNDSGIVAKNAWCNDAFLFSNFWTKALNSQRKEAFLSFLELSPRGPGGWNNWIDSKGIGCKNYWSNWHDIQQSLLDSNNTNWPWKWWNWPANERKLELLINCWYAVVPTDQYSSECCQWHQSSHQILNIATSVPSKPSQDIWNTLLTKEWLWNQLKDCSLSALLMQILPDSTITYQIILVCLFALSIRLTLSCVPSN